MKNEVKQVLMNELGLTRESVRAVLAEEVVTDTVQRQLEQSGYLRALLGDIVRMELGKVLGKRESYSSDDALTQMVRGALKEEAHKAVIERVKIDVQEVEPKP